MRSATKVTKELLDAATNLKVVGRAEQLLVTLVAEQIARPSWAGMIARAVPPVTEAGFQVDVDAAPAACRRSRP